MKKIMLLLTIITFASTLQPMNKDEGDYIDIEERIEFLELLSDIDREYDRLVADFQRQERQEKFRKQRDFDELQAILEKHTNGEQQ